MLGMSKATGTHRIERKGARSMYVVRGHGFTWSIDDHRKLERDLFWFAKNSDTLRKRYNNRWIAIKGRKVVAASPTFKGLETELRKQNVDKEESLIRRIPPQGMKLTI